MSNTPNYDLYLTDNDAISFLEWRKKINGTENSNMMKIDAALAEKAEDSNVIHKTGSDVVVGGLTDRKDGADGVTPHIGENGNWYLGDVDTGKPSRGANGKDGADGETGPAGPKGDAFTYADFTAEQLAALKGEKGDKGDKGDTGDTGSTGPQGPSGTDGKSAYASAQDGGYTGTEAAFNTALAQVPSKADKAVSRSVTLTAAGWSSGVQAVAVTGLLAASNGTLAIAQSATDEQWEAWAAAAVRATGQADGSLTLQATGSVPAVDIPVEVIIL